MLTARRNFLGNYGTPSVCKRRFNGSPVRIFIGITVICVCIIKRLCFNLFFCFAFVSKYLSFPLLMWSAYKRKCLCKGFYRFTKSKRITKKQPVKNSSFVFKLQKQILKFHRRKKTLIFCFRAEQQKRLVQISKRPSVLFKNFLSTLTSAHAARHSFRSFPRNFPQKKSVVRIPHKATVIAQKRSH